MEQLRIAITKGRLLEDSIALFERAGYDCEALKKPGRRLIHPIGPAPSPGCWPRPRT